MRQQVSKEFEIFQRLLKASTANLAQSFYDSFVEKNANLRSKAGVKTSIIRRQIGKCCKWCSDLAGTYENGSQPKDIYKRHENCRCLVTFKSEKGTYTDDWNKKEFKTQKDARLAREKELTTGAKEATSLKDAADKLLKNVNFKTGRMSKDEYLNYKKELSYAEKSYNQIQLSKTEYSHIMSEINDNLSDEDRTHAIVSKAIGGFIYTFINKGFNNYIIIKKVPIK